jgi:hypothetical protein
LAIPLRNNTSKMCSSKKPAEIGMQRKTLFDSLRKLAPSRRQVATLFACAISGSAFAQSQPLFPPATNNASQVNFGQFQSPIETTYQPAWFTEERSRQSGQTPIASPQEDAFLWTELPPQQPALPNEALTAPFSTAQLSPTTTIQKSLAGYSENQFDGSLGFATQQIPAIEEPCIPQLGFSPPPTIGFPSWKTVDSPEQVYDNKYPVPVQRPWIEWGRQFYGPGMMEPGGTVFGEFNLTHPMFLVYGDFRTGIGVGENAAGTFSNVAARLNLDLDFWITSTERFHGFIGPLNNGGQFTQVNFEDGSLEFEGVFNANLVNGYFEGDLGYMLGGLTNNPAQFDLPIAAGLMPLLYQNGIWMDDAITGIAVAQNAQHSRLLRWSNFDATAFAIFDQLNSPVFGNDNHAGQALGTAWFIEAYDGYIEAGYAYIRDRHGLGRSYHNATIAYTRRYFDRISNSVRFIVNAGQDLPKAERSADGGLVLLESSWITASPLTFVPYMNVFYGYGRPQSVARAGGAGGVLRNVGITFETDGLNGYPTLDDSGINSVGGAIGVNLLGASLDRQLVVEASVVHGYGSDAGRVSNGDQYGVGARYQLPLSNATLLRLDTMYGFRESDEDLYGARAEFRYKF